MTDDGDEGQATLLSGLLSRQVSFVTLTLIAGTLWRWKALALGEWIWLAAFILTMLIRMPHLKRNSGNKVPGPRKSRSETLPALILLVTLLLPLMHLATDGLPSFDYRLPFACTLVGGLVQWPYLWLFYRSHADLLRNWSPGLEIRDGHELVVHGVYNRIRHPMYAAVWLSALAQPLLIQNWLAGPPVLLAVCAFWFVRVPVEERMMAAHFGDAYAAYAARTGRLLPVRRHG
ncbi:protein-S-isoprenylcysteine O-methyltransferase [Shinella sp.]|uniref:protein-S-isoprenylcysteine O-methyltransferase n=1 Tax=Shinella sp. TaxID=1870904 RepID=UPI003F6F0973